MLTGLSHLGLEVKYLDRAQAFYRERLGLDVNRRTDAELAFDVGETTVVLRRPVTVPRGGLHVHYAFSTPPWAYDNWADRLERLDPVEFDFGSYRSLYVDDPDDHCVEVGEVDEADSAGAAADSGDGALPLTGVFEVVLEVESIDAAERRYRGLGFEVVDRGDDRHRVRLRGPMDLELWEPQLGIADARGGVHVDLGFVCEEPEAAAARVAAAGSDPVGVAVDDREGVRVREDDGHWLTFLQPTN